MCSINSCSKLFSSNKKIDDLFLTFSNAQIFIYFVLKTHKSHICLFEFHSHKLNFLYLKKKKIVYLEEPKYNKFIFAGETHIHTKKL